MSGRFLIPLALAAAIGGAAAAQQTPAIQVDPGGRDHSVPLAGVEVAAVADLEFGIDDHRHDRGLERHRDGRRFRVPEHRPRRDRFDASEDRHQRRPDVGRERLGRERHRGPRRRLHCDTALGSSVLAFC